MTHNQQVALNKLETAIKAPRREYRIRDIKIEFAQYKKTLKKVPWWKKIFEWRK